MLVEAPVAFFALLSAVVAFLVDFLADLSGLFNCLSGLLSRVSGWLVSGICCCRVSSRGGWLSRRRGPSLTAVIVIVICGNQIVQDLLTNGGQFLVSGSLV